MRKRITDEESEEERGPEIYPESKVTEEERALRWEVRNIGTSRDFIKY